MDESKKHYLWFGFNGLWWVISIVANIYYGVDVNPALSDPSEVVLNVGVWVIGHTILRKDETVAIINGEPKTERELR